LDAHRADHVCGGHRRGHHSHDGLAGVDGVEVVALEHALLGAEDLAAQGARLLALPLVQRQLDAALPGLTAPAR
jgi:hypothetical protein